MAYFTINNSITVPGKFIFRFLGENHKQILGSELYNSKQACQDGIASVKRNSPNETAYRRFVNARGEYAFNIVATNGEPIAKGSEGYDTTYGREHAINIVKRDAATALVYDRT